MSVAGDSLKMPTRKKGCQFWLYPTRTQQEWDCPSCHAHHHRDENASKNLKAAGMRRFQPQRIVIHTVGTTGSGACGDRGRTRLMVATVEEARISRFKAREVQVCQVSTRQQGGTRA